MDTTVKQEPAISWVTEQLTQERMVDYLLSYTTQIVADEHLLWVARTLPQQQMRPNPEILIYKLSLILKGRIAYI